VWGSASGGKGGGGVRDHRFLNSWGTKRKQHMGRRTGKMIHRGLRGDKGQGNQAQEAMNDQWGKVRQKVVIAGPPWMRDGALGVRRKGSLGR